MKYTKALSLVTIVGSLIACSYFSNVRQSPTPIPPTTVPSPTQDLNFSLDSGNTLPPDDVIQEIGYFGGAGGSPGCYEDRTDPYIYEDTAEFEFMELVWVLLCNLPPNGEASVTINLPDSTAQNEIVMVDESGELFYKYIPELESPIGTYTFSFDLSNAHLEKTVTVAKPAEARLYVLGEDWDNPDEERLIILYNLLPNERVRLFAYSDLRLVLWREFIVDKSGMLTIQNQLEQHKYQFAAVGEVTGVAYQRIKGWGFGAYTQWVDGAIYCAGAPKPILGIHPEAEVVVISDHAFVQYGEFDAQGNSIIHQLQLPKGTELKIWGLSSPLCDENAYWWTVRCEDISNGEYCGEMSSGTIAEQIGADQFIEPINK